MRTVRKTLREMNRQVNESRLKNKSFPTHLKCASSAAFDWWKFADYVTGFFKPPRVAAATAVRICTYTYILLMEYSSSWTRKDVSYCYCDSLSYTHAHCPCTSCNGKAVSRSTEYRHWLDANAERYNEQEEGTATDPVVTDEQDYLCMSDEECTSTDLVVADEQDDLCMSDEECTSTTDLVVADEQDDLCMSDEECTSTTDLVVADEQDDLCMSDEECTSTTDLVVADEQDDLCMSDEECTSTTDLVVADEQDDLCMTDEECTSTDPMIANEQDDLRMRDDTIMEGSGSRSLYEVPPMNEAMAVGEIGMHMHTIIVNLANNIYTMRTSQM